VATDTRRHREGTQRCNTTLECIAPLETFLQAIANKLELEPGQRTPLRDISH
jgi:hypothetical protein